MANLELEAKLTKAISAFRLREMLTKFGFGENEEVRLSLKTSHPEPLAYVKIPPTTIEADIQAGSLCLESFKQMVKDEFINQAINTLELEVTENNIELIFSSSDTNIRISASCCCRVNGLCCCYC